jgi:malonate transporter
VSVALLLLPDFLLILGGALLKRMHGFQAPFWAGLERLVYFVLFPALLFRSLAQSPLALGDAGRLVAVALAFTLSGMALSALARPLFRLEPATFASCFQCGFRFNTYLALAAASRIAGDTGVAAIGLLVGVLVPVVNFAAVAVLARGGRARIAWELARNPLVIACLAGFAWQLGGLPLPATVKRILDLLGSAALPLGLLAVGAGLKLTRVTLPLPALAWWHGVKLIALPAIAYALAHTVGLSALERQIAVAMAAVPTAPSAYILAAQMGGQGAPVALIISSGTVLAAVTLPLWLAAAAP